MRFESLEEFGRQLAKILDVDVEKIRSYDGLFDDWGLDSLQAFQMIIVTEAMAGAVVPPPEIPEIFTVGDAYAYYRSLVVLES